MPKSPEANHNWQPLSSRKGVECTKCQYSVVSVPANDPETRGGSRHVPTERTIYTTEQEVNGNFASGLCKIWGVRCKPDV